MEYRVIKPINNNVVLVSDGESDEQMVLMAKGIGFNRRHGDVISDQVGDKKIYKLWNENGNIKNVDYNLEEVESAVEDIVELAKERLGIQSEKLYKALLDHIIFAIDRLRFGLPIENPFIDEISVFYSKEYQVAQIAVNMLKDKLNVDVGAAEAGFIALHLHSAKKNSPINLSIENVRMYNSIVEVMSDFFGRDLTAHSSEIRAFLLSLDSTLRANRKGKQLKLGFSQKIFKMMPESYKLTVKILDVISKETDINLSEDAAAYITVDIERLRQANI